MSRWRQVWLVAWREIIERGRSRGFLLSLVLTGGIIIAGFALPEILIDDDEGPRIGLPAGGPASLDMALVAAGQALDTEVEAVAQADRAAAIAALEGEEIDAVLDVPADLSTAGELVVRESADDVLRAITTAAVVSLRTDEVLTEAGVAPETLSEAGEPPGLVALEPGWQADRDAFLVANIGVVLMLAAILSFGLSVLTGIIEEKQSRVVEVVLSSVRPRDLLMGKVLGIGLLGIFQLVVFLLAGLTVIAMTGQFTLPETALPTLLQLLLWFGLGYALYATIFGFLGSLASRMEEASNVTSPVMMLLVGAYLVSLFVVGDDADGLLAVVISLIPFTAPLAVPLRAAQDAISLLEVAAAIGITVATIWLLFVIGGRIYSGAVLETAGRVPLRDAVRRATRG